ncbi:unnamed protein product [Ixodes pacificus]
MYENIVYINDYIPLLLEPPPFICNIAKNKQKKQVLRKHSVLCVGHRRGRCRRSSSAASLSGMCWLRCLCVTPSPVPFREIAFTKEASVVGKYFFFHAPFWPKMDSSARRDPH